MSELKACGKWYVYTNEYSEVQGKRVDVERRCSGHELCHDCIDALRARIAEHRDVLKYIIASGPTDYKHIKSLCEKELKRLAD